MIPSKCCMMAVAAVEKPAQKHPTDWMDDLYICQFGEEKCRPSHAYGPAQRNHYLIHFVVSGSGMLQCGGRTWPVQAGHGFLILPGEETYYQADADTPWHYAWVGYRGQKADALTRSSGLDAAHRVFAAQSPQEAWHTLATLRQDAQALRQGQLAATGSLLRFMALIAPLQGQVTEASLMEEYCEKARWYMEGRFDRGVTVQETADFVGLSRSQLYRVMVEGCGASPKEVLLRIRMRHAAQMLTDTTLTLEEIAHRVGLQTGSQLGVAFQRQYGVTPGRYRRERRG